MSKRNTSLRVDVAVWFALNPDEMLNTADCAVKFDAERTLCYTALASLARDGYIELVVGQWPRTFAIGPTLRAALAQAKVAQ